MIETSPSRVPIALVVNDRTVTAQVEARLHLGDFLRDHLRLTGTHLGCEHGVCGACTVLLNDAPVRSCITYAAACDGLEVRTIEGFEKDERMALLRETFSQEHGLQCGFCTPGMLITARDILQRLPHADERQVRVELSGNLCRCTGYKGIVNAVCAALKSANRGNGEAAAPGAAPRVQMAFTAFAPAAAASRQAQGPAPVSSEATGSGSAALRTQKGTTHVEDSFVVSVPPDRVWPVFRDLPLLASCLPGAELQEYDEHSLKGLIKVRLGPISAAFAGAAVIERDDATLSGCIRGAGSDQRSGSRTRGELSYRLVPVNDGNSTKVLANIDYALQGSLAQFSRSGLAQEMGRVLVAQFAENLNRRLGVGAGVNGSGNLDVSTAQSLSLWRISWRAFRNLLR